MWVSGAGGNDLPACGGALPAARARLRARRGRWLRTVSLSCWNRTSWASGSEEKEPGFPVRCRGALLGQTHHVYWCSPKGILSPNLHAQLFVGHRFVVSPLYAPAGGDLFGAAQAAEDIVADDAEMPALLGPNLPFHG